jgi:hypothetical protein
MVKNLLIQYNIKGTLSSEHLCLELVRLSRDRWGHMVLGLTNFETLFIFSLALEDHKQLALNAYNSHFL